ncbi:alanine dehydrogenase [Halopseudomonas maritima]|uniref:alanine dehydrogenase n=1 Tax=Halopseudomonas maritima TaxID=2918528 RepID=UPI001EEBE848|nr:alanine dehydrogenase [Halopseudomonas maritima]UJJ30393.1 alanine dehydrogenase [Halopseudomonas maritima]
MFIGVPTEIKNHEYRVGLTPDSVRELSAHGHQLLVQSGAGSAIGFTDDDYSEAGARLVSREQVFSDSELVVKVKEPQAEERRLLRPGQTLFTYLHLAPDPAQTHDLLASGATCIAYETVTDELGRLPLLAPMSEVAGRMAIQAGAGCLEKARGGRGVLLGGVPGVPQGRVVILGGGVVGRNAVAMAVGLGAQVEVLDKSVDVLRGLDAQYGNRIQTRYATAVAVESALLDADLVVGAVLVPGAAAPKLISAELVRRMPAGSVLVDVAIDQGGCAETSRPTTHADPTYLVDGVVHYCVANMPGAVARTATQALNNATLPFVQALANKGVARALRDDPHLARGLNVSKGALCNAEVGSALSLPVQSLHEALAALGAAG